MIKSLEILSYEERLQELRLFIWRRLRGHLRNVYKYLKGEYQEPDSSVLTSDKLKGNEHRLKHRTFHLNTKKIIIVRRALLQISQRGCGVSLFGGCENLPGCNPMQDALSDCLSNGVGLDVLQWSFQPQPFFCLCACELKTTEKSFSFDHKCSHTKNKSLYVL